MSHVLNLQTCILSTPCRILQRCLAEGTEKLCLKEEIFWSCYLHHVHVQTLEWMIQWGIQRWNGHTIRLPGCSEIKFILDIKCKNYDVGIGILTDLITWPYYNSVHDHKWDRVRCVNWANDMNLNHNITYQLQGEQTKSLSGEAPMNRPEFIFASLFPWHCNFHAIPQTYHSSNGALTILM